jgi:hypothetical protein
LAAAERDAAIRNATATDGRRPVFIAVIVQERLAGKNWKEKTGGGQAVNAYRQSAFVVVANLL